MKIDQNLKDATAWLMEALAGKVSMDPPNDLAKEGAYEYMEAAKYDVEAGVQKLMDEGQWAKPAQHDPITNVLVLRAVLDALLPDDKAKNRDKLNTIRAMTMAAVIRSLDSEGTTIIGAERLDGGPPDEDVIRSMKHDSIKDAAKGMRELLNDDFIRNKAGPIAFVNQVSKAITDGLGSEWLGEDGNGETHLFKVLSKLPAETTEAGIGTFFNAVLDGYGMEPKQGTRVLRRAAVDRLERIDATLLSVDSSDADEIVSQLGGLMDRIVGKIRSKRGDDDCPCPTCVDRRKRQAKDTQVH